MTLRYVSNKNKIKKKTHLEMFVNIIRGGS